MAVTNSKGPFYRGVCLTERQLKGVKIGGEHGVCLIQRQRKEVKKGRDQTEVSVLAWRPLGES